MRLTPTTTAICFAGGSGAASRSQQLPPFPITRARAADGVYPTAEIRAPHQAHVRGILSEDLIAAAAALDLPARALGRELPGTSLAEVALARGLDPMVVADALFARALLAITRRLKAEVISVEQSIEVAQRVRETIDWRVYWQVQCSSQSAYADVG